MPPQKLAFDARKYLGQWIMYPDLLPNKRFRGFENRDDASLLRGAWVLGENTSFVGSSLPTLRKGYEPIGTEVTDATPVRRAWVFETRTGVKWELKSYATGVYYWKQGTSTEWSLLKGSFTTGLEFTFANIGESGGEYHSFFCNGTDAWQQFNGMSGTVDSVTGTTIVFTATIASLGFYTTGTRSVIIDGTEYAYTGQSGSTLTGVTPDPSAGGVVAGDLAVQSPRAVTAMASFLSSVAFAHDGRIHVRLDTAKSVWNYSMLDNPDDFTTGSTDGDGGTKDIEFSGPITAFGKLNKAIICCKERLLKSLVFTQSGARIDVPFYQTLFPADDKSTSLGAINQRSTFSTPFGLVFVTPDKRMVLLSGITANNEPEFLNLSDPIQPTFTAGDHSDATGICVGYTLYYAFKSDSTVTANDTVLVADMTKQTFDTNGRVLPVQWDTPYIGWNVKDWTALKNASNEIEVHFHSSLNSNSYRVIDTKVDNTGPFTSTARSWSENFDIPTKQKKIDMCFIEAQMKEHTELTVTLLYDESGFTGREEYVLDATDAAYRFSISEYNPFGFSPFGTKKFGSNPNVDDSPVYRFYIELPGNLFFFNIALQLSVDGDGMDYQLVRFGYRLKEIVDEPPRTLKIGSS